MKNKKVVIFIFFFLIILLFNYNSIVYTCYQRDFIFICDRIIESYSFISYEEEQSFIKNRNKYLKKIRNCIDDDEFVKEVNLFLSNLYSIHTRLNNRFDSYAIYEVYKNVSSEQKEYEEKFKYIVSEFEKKDVLNKYTKVKRNKTKINPVYSLETNDNNFRYFTIIENKIGYIRIENLAHANINVDSYKVKKCLNNFKNFETLIIDLRGNYGGDSTYFTDMFLPMIIKKNLHMENYSLIRSITPATKNIKDIKKIDNNIELKDKLKKQSGYIKNRYTYYYKLYTNVIKNKDSIEYDGKLYFLIDENTASSAAYFAALVKDTKLGILVGNNTMPESIGNDAAMYILPMSKLLLRINDELILSNDLDFGNNRQLTNGVIYPNIFTNSNLNDNLNYNSAKYDNCINAILEIETNFN